MNLQDAKYNCDAMKKRFDDADNLCKSKRKELKELELEAARRRIEFIDSVQKLKDAQLHSRRKK